MQVEGQNKYTCPLRNSGNCCSKRQSDIARHFFECHNETILINDNRSVSLQIDLNKEALQCNLAYIANKNYLIVSRVGLEDFMAAIFGNEEDQMRISLGDIDSSHIVSTCAVSQYCALQSFNVWDANVGVAYDIGALRALFPVGTTTLNIETVHSSVGNDIMLNNLESIVCIVCQLYLKPPILLCVAGHSICEKCKLKITHCPTCRGSYGSARNYALEAISEHILYPCKHNDAGCSLFIHSGELQEHETNCVMRSYKCCLNACTWSGSRILIGQHLLSQHADSLIFRDNKFVIKLNELVFPPNECKVAVLICYGEVFKICITKGNAYNLFCQLIGPEGKAQQFGFNVSFCEIATKRKITRDDVCKDRVGSGNDCKEHAGKSITVAVGEVSGWNQEQTELSCQISEI